ncbi:MAG TPA: alpha/beta hydrolase [Rubrobacter sp.]|nr:alpha/beta hydrolase [Rubrobacter sp.]
MIQSRTGPLKVSDATLHYEVCGTGPVLLLIPGGPADAGGFAPIRDVLSDRYTVVTYDPRGLSRSQIDGEARDTTVQIFAQDAHELLAALGSEPAYVFGDSGGAIYGLELVAQYTEQVRLLVVHEPPLVCLLDDADEHARFGREIYDTYRSEGIGPAMEKFATGTGLDQDEPWPVDPTPELAEAIARMQGNMDFFLGHMWLPLGDYAPDISRLRSRPITVAVGETSEGQLAYRAAVTLAEQLGKEPIVFPGGHSGTITQSEAYAGRIHEVLSTY